MTALFLGASDIEKLALPLDEIAAVVAEMFTAKSVGQNRVSPRATLKTSNNFAYQFSGAALEEPALAGLKWVALAPSKSGVPHVGGTILLNDGTNGKLIGVLDAKWIIEVRTAAATVIGAKYLARPDSARIGFIGCGRQAYSHLDALSAQFPVKHVAAFSRTVASAEAFARHAEKRGLTSQVETNPERAVANMDIVVTMVPSGSPPFLDISSLSPGSLAAFVDFGNAWHIANADQLDYVVTDDRKIIEALVESGRIRYRGPIHAELHQVISGAMPARQTKDERIAWFPLGIPQADLAIAWKLYHRARSKNIGTPLHS